MIEFVKYIHKICWFESDKHFLYMCTMTLSVLRCTDASFGRRVWSVLEEGQSVACRGGPEVQNSSSWSSAGPGSFSLLCAASCQDVDTVPPRRI